MKEIKWQVEENEDGDWAVFLGKSVINVKTKDEANVLCLLLELMQATPDYS